MNRRSTPAAILLLLATGASAAEGISASLLDLTGNKRVKLVFSRDTSAQCKNFFGEANVFELYVYDTADDEIRLIKSILDDYSKPLITHDGSRIVYSDRLERKVRVVNWDGSVGAGYAFEALVDLQTAATATARIARR